ncbi:hypothetical protein ABLV49_02220 [Polaromonas hydrogenivorans]|uniref:Uncharacterized protein n=1 Tax=Polaromonas hydrogenivorans TaxID=335476 RepID=A0AAU7LSQ5_9BURK
MSWAWAWAWAWRQAAASAGPNKAERCTVITQDPVDDPRGF